ncbi:hypothetical protein, partial [Streptococcus pneumoniae]|uniref:hypothetical protein n=1 Tax=Streptococcus pneumoniae TaxID=1313 RepID=UPI001E49D8F3
AQSNLRYAGGVAKGQKPPKTASVAQSKKTLTEFQGVKNMFEAIMKFFRGSNSKIRECVKCGWLYDDDFPHSC